MIEVVNKLYTQRFLAKELKWSDLFQAVTYTQYEGDWGGVMRWYKIIYGETSTLDLTRSEDEILAAMKSNTRNEIKRAIKEGCEFEHNTDYAAFVPFFNDFAISKGLPERVDVHTLAKYDKTVITVAKKDGVVLAMHATVVNPKDGESLLLYSCSKRLDQTVDRKLIGWANRFLHYRDFLLFKEMGATKYEWNGICTDPQRKEVYNISQFKLSFGSEPQKQLNLRTPLFVLMKKAQKILSTIKR